MKKRFLIYLIVVFFLVGLLLLFKYPLQARDLYKKNFPNQYCSAFSGPTPAVIGDPEIVGNCVKNGCKVVEKRYLQNNSNCFDCDQYEFKCVAK